MSAMTICKVLIAGEANFRRSLAEPFAALPQFTLSEVDCLARAAECIATEPPDVLLIDHELAGSEPRQTISRLRSRGLAGPILLFAATRQELESALGECVIRPFRFAEVLARLRALLHERETKFDETLMIGPYPFRPSSGDLTKSGGESVRLTETESAILLRLARAGGTGVSREVLLRDVWGYNPAVATRTLETHIYRIRRKIEGDPMRPTLLMREAGGYRLASTEICSTLSGV
jgi:DNA-binding response OmpR family regulator